jgi:hypothetical protein
VLGNPLRYTDPSGHCIMRDDDGFGSILQTRGDWFDCTADEFAGIAFDWELLEFWLSIASNKPTGFYDDISNKNRVIKLFKERGYYGALGYLGLNQHGATTDTSGCSVKSATVLSVSPRGRRRSRK